MTSCPSMTQRLFCSLSTTRRRRYRPFALSSSISASRNASGFRARAVVVGASATMPPRLRWIGHGLKDRRGPPWPGNDLGNQHNLTGVARGDEIEALPPVGEVEPMGDD